MIEFCASGWHVPDVPGKGESSANSEEGKFSAAYDVCNQKSDGSFVAKMDCIKAETEQQDILLNSAYKQVMSVLTQQQLDSRKNELLQFERLWIKGRDAKCRYEAADNSDAAQLSASLCILNLTTERSRELQVERERLN